MKRITLLSGLFLAIFMISASGCEKMQTEDLAETEGVEDVAAQAEEVQMAAPTQSTVGTIVVNETPFSVEIAVTEDEKANGLSGRESLPDNSGMWFAFDEPGLHKFWMQGMEFPLDFIFIDEDMKVVCVFPNASPDSTALIPPNSDCPTPYMYVLEVNAGKAEQNNIKAGDLVQKRIGE